MKYKRSWVAAGVVALVSINSPAIAATLSNAEGQSCEGTLGTWHFVNTQTGGEQTPGWLTATFSDGGVFTVEASKVLKSVQHFYVTSTGTLLGAESTLDGRLVLSDFSCEDDGEVKK